MLSNRGCIYLVLVHSDYEHPSKTDAYLFFQIHIYNKYWTKKKKKVTSGIEAKEWSEFIKVCPEKVYEDSWDRVAILVPAYLEHHEIFRENTNL